MRLLVAFIFLQAGYLSSSLRSNTDTTGSGCYLVKGAKRRSRLHFSLNMCKCAAPDAVLTWKCGRQAGERKFDVTRRDLYIGPDCNCSVPEFPKAGRKASTSEVTESESDGEETKKEKPCAHWGAVPRTGRFHKGCKCEEDWSLSGDCGDLEMERKFRPKDKAVQNSTCKCVKDEEHLRDEKLVGAIEPSPKIDPPEEEGSQVAKEEASPPKEEASPQTVKRCEKPPPEPFQLGDIVRIEKKVHIGYRYEFAGVGVGAIYKNAGISGTIAQVVCAKDTAAVEGRVCLRKGAAWVGCFPVANLVKVDD